MRTAEQWTKILTLCGVKQATAEKWGPVFAEEIKDGTFSKGDADISDFLPEILHESFMLQKLEEDLDYSAQRLVAVWPSRFPTVVDAYPYAHNPRALAEKVYGGRLGNTRNGDGWTYRGRGILQITGLANYKMLSGLVGQDFVGIPDLLVQPHFALDACVRWWEGEIPDSMLGETTRIRQRVNGGTIGLAEVQRLTKLVKGAL